ncbi:MAG TPA: hypothetical protein VNW46_17400 [Gemmatimonadaceae bacterium]|nr:hypothetical protein [Gemmatimonadaceae bacterium]
MTGDESTLGGYVAVHARPPAFEGVDGQPYSVDVGVDETGDPAAPVGAYLFFVRWGNQAVTGHLETEFLVRGVSEDAVREAIGRMPLLTVKATLDAVIRRGSGCGG